MENNCIIKGMETKFVGWLSPKTIQNKKASSLSVEFTKPEHAIDEGLIMTRRCNSANTTIGAASSSNTSIANNIDT
jgi:hypothetical protein